MYLLFKIEDYYPSGGFSDIEFVFENAKELEEVLDEKLEPSDYDYASIKIWEVKSLEELREIKPFYFGGEKDKFLVYSSRPTETIWKDKNLHKKPEKLIKTLYRDIVENLGLTKQD